MSLLHADEPFGTEVTVKNTQTGEFMDARVDTGGIIRERDGPASFSQDVYKIVSIEGSERSETDRDGPKGRYRHVVKLLRTNGDKVRKSVYEQDNEDLSLHQIRRRAERRHGGQALKVKETFTWDPRRGCYT